MAGPVVPQLAEKLRLLVTHGVFPDMKVLSQSLGRTPNTLRWWASGDAARVPGTISSQAWPKLVAVVAGALPNLSDEQVRQVLAGPADDLATLLAGRRMPSLSDLIDRMADRTSGKLFVRANGLSMVRTRAAAKAEARYQVRLGQDFRIEFPRNARGGYLAALQAAAGGWSIVPATFDAAARSILLPGLDGNYEPDWMFEESDLGAHTFVVLQAGRPFPAELAAAARDRVTLDRGLIAHLVRNFEAQDKSTRRVYALDLEITQSDTP